MSRRCPSVVSLKQILCFLLERCEVFSHWSDSSLFLCWRWNSAASQSGREEKDQTCSTKWRAEDVKLVSDAAISLQIQNGVDRNQWNTITERRLQSEHTDDTWRCRLLIYSRFFLKLFCYLLCLNSCFKVKIFLALVVVGSADGWPVTSEDFVFAAVAEMCFICTFQLQTRPAETQRKLNRPETKDGRITCLTSSSVSSFYPSLRVRTETIMVKHKRFCLDKTLIPFVCEEERNSAGRSCCNLCVFIGTCVFISLGSNAADLRFHQIVWRRSGPVQSGCAPLTRGAPQGSVLGSVWFHIMGITVWMFQRNLQLLYNAC